MLKIQLNIENKDSKKLEDIMNSHANKLKMSLENAKTREDKYSAIYAFYRKFYTLTLCKSCLNAGINRSPTRDIILDYPWKDLHQDRIFCLQIWDKINH